MLNWWVGEKFHAASTFPNLTGEACCGTGLTKDTPGFGWTGEESWSTPMGSLATAAPTAPGWENCWGGVVTGGGVTRAC